MNCPRCNHENAQNTRYCDFCARRLTAPTDSVTSRDGPSSVFVGRRRELNELTSALEDAISDHGQVAMLSGDPGIGKTRIAQELAALADARNAEVHWGHCYEGEGAPPYWPWLQIIRTQIDQSDVERLESVMGSGAEAIGEIVPELRSKMPYLGTLPTFDPDSARFRLFDSITTYLKNASADRPIVLVLEDLHWADLSSLALLEHIAGNIAASRLLIIGTYRDIEVSLDHPLSQTLGSLVRHQGFQSLQLGGLSLGEVGELVTQSVGSDASPGVAEQVHHRTEGNALFVGELLKLLESGGLDDAQEWQFAIPQGVRGVISRRLTGLSDECNRVLAIASVIGRDFDFDLLARMTDTSDDDLLDVVDEALEARVIEDMPGAIERYRFSHALIQQTLYERQSTSRRARLHSRIGETLEDIYSNDLEGRASELVAHFSRSPRRQDSEKALRYGRLAASQAASVYAYGEAAAYLEKCLDVQKSLDPHDDETRCDLLINLGWALIPAREPQRAYEEVAPEAFTLAEALEDRDRAFHACHVAIEAIVNHGGPIATATPAYRQWVERADKYAEPESVARVRADVSLSFVRRNEGQIEEGWFLVQRALALARQLDDPEYILLCVWGLISLGGWQLQYEEELFHLAEEFSEPYGSGMSTRRQGQVLWASSRYIFANGDRDRADAVWQHFEEVADRSMDPYLRVTWLGRQASLRFWDGLLEEAIEGIDRLVAVSEEMGMPVLGLQGAVEAGFRPLLYLGRGEEALAALPRARQLAGMEEGPPGPMHVLCFAHMGRLTDAREAYHHLMERQENLIKAKRAPANVLCDLLEATVLLEEPEAANILAEHLDGIAAMVRNDFWSGRHLGGAAKLSGEPEKALGYYRKALDASIKMRVRPEIALTRLELAELLTESYPSQRGEAMEHLEFAIADFRDMKMKPSLDRALALKEKAESQPPRRPSYPDGLTRREVEVLRLVATGMTNRQIADELVVSQKTVAYHVTNILNKTTSANRAEATAYAVRQNLTS